MGGVEQVVGHPGQLQHLAVQGRRELLQRGRQIVVGREQLGQSGDCVQWVAEFVAHGGYQPSPLVGFGDGLVAKCRQLGAGRALVGDVAGRDDDALDVRVVEQVHGADLEDVVSAFGVDHREVVDEDRPGFGQDGVAHRDHACGVIGDEDVEDRAGLQNSLG